VHNGAAEQVVFVVGLNERKFFGPDGAEEALKLLERVADHDPGYRLLLGLNEKQLEEIEQDHKVKHRKLTPSRELEGVLNAEFVPIVQAGMVDQRPRLAIDRPWRISQSHIAQQLWKHPREALNVYWSFWQRDQIKDAHRFEFCMHYFPVAAGEYFYERADLFAIRVVVKVIAQRLQGKGGTTVLVVGNEMFQPVTERLKARLDDAAGDRLVSPEYSTELQSRAQLLCTRVMDLTPALAFVYFGIPLLILQQVYLIIKNCGPAIFEDSEPVATRD
jgi:hypothetical protein